MSGTIDSFHAMWPAYLAKCVSTGVQAYAKEGRGGGDGEHF